MAQPPHRFTRAWCPLRASSQEDASRQSSSSMPVEHLRLEERRAALSEADIDAGERREHQEVPHLRPCDLEAADRPDPSAPSKEVGLNDRRSASRMKCCIGSLCAISEVVVVNAELASRLDLIRARPADKRPGSGKNVGASICRGHAPGGRSADDHLPRPARPGCGNVVARPDVHSAQQIVASLGQVCTSQSCSRCTRGAPALGLAGCGRSSRPRCHDARPAPRPRPVRGGRTRGSRV